MRQKGFSVGDNPIASNQNFVLADRTIMTPQHFPHKSEVFLLEISFYRAAQSVKFNEKTPCSVNC
jgi:hypothetical protein